MIKHYTHKQKSSLLQRLLGVVMVFMLAQNLFAQTPTIQQYQVTRSTRTYDTAYSPTAYCITATVNPVGLTSGTADDGRWVVNLPWLFNYNGSVYSKVTVCTNGWLGFGDNASTAYQTANAFSGTAPNTIAFPWYRDLNGNFGNTFNSALAGMRAGNGDTTGVFVVEWRNVAATSSGSTANYLNFQVWLFGPSSSSPGKIQFHYGPRFGTLSASSAIGLADSISTSGRWINMASGGSFTSTTLATTYPGTDSLYTFTPPPLSLGTITGSQVSTNVGAGATDQSVISITIPTNGILGTYTLDRVRFNTNNTDNADIVSNGVKLWVGTSTAPVTQIGSGQTIVGDSVSFTGLNYPLTPTTYLWLTMSTSGSATSGNTIDALLPSGGISISASNGASTPAATIPASDIDPAGSRQITAPATYVGTTLHQYNTPATINKGTTGVLLLAAKVVRSTSGAPINLSRIVLNTTGSTAIATDAANIKMYTTGSSNVFSSTTQFGSTYTTPAATMAFNGTVVLNADTNYFWVVGDVKSTAVGGDTLDIGTDSVYVNGTAYSPSSTTATGYSIITPTPLNYSITRSTGNSYTSILSNGNNFASWSSSSGDDNLSAATTMPFNFSYAGVNVTSFKVCTNGWMTLNGASVTSNTWTNNLNGNSSTQNTIVAPFWDDLVVPGQVFANINSIKYKVDTVSVSPLRRVLIVEWSGMERYNTPSPSLNFQVRLYETTNVIEFAYGNMTAFDGTANVQWTYSCGLNTWLTSTGLGSGEVLAQQQPQTNVFSHLGTGSSGSGAEGLSWAPQSYSKLTFTPGANTGGTALAKVSNDECSNAISLNIASNAPSEFGNTYRTGGATASSSIPTCTATTPGNADDDVWFTFTNSSTRDVTITCRAGYAFDPVVQVFSGTCGSLTSINCTNANATQGGTEEFTLTSLASGTYYVRVYHSGAGYSAASADSGVFSLDIYSVPPPANDTINGAISLSANNTTCTPTATQSTLNATASPEYTCGGTPTKDVWYYFVATASGHTVTVTPVTPGTTFNPHVQVFDLGGSFNSANATSTNSIVCQNNAGINAAEVVSLSGLTIGNYYAIRVYHTLGGAGGTGNFNICVVVPPNSMGTITATQQTGIAAPSTPNVPIMLVQVPVTGGAGTLTLNSIRITASNTNNADIDTVKLWQTAGTTFTSPTLLGAQTLSGGQATFSSLGLSLTGTSNFFVTYNITSGATVNNTLDLNIASGDISISNAGGATAPGTQPASTLNPAGNVVVDIPLDFAITRTTGITYNSIMSNGNSYGFTGSNGDDQLSPAISLPFTFQYKGITVSSVKACTNGWMTLNGGSVTSSAWSNSLTSNSSTLNGILAPHWDDLVCTGNSTYTTGSDLDQSMKWKIDTVSTSPLRRVFIAEWAGMEQFLAPGPNLNFQVRLYEATNVIEYAYGNMSQFDGTAIDEFSYSVGMNSFGTTTQGVGQFLALQETNTDKFDAIGKDDHSWSPECYSKLTFTPGTHGAGTALPALSNDTATSPVVLSVGTSTPTQFCAVYRTKGATGGSYAVPTGNADDDVWFSFTTTSTKSFVIDLRSGPSFDGVWQLFNSGMSSMVVCNKTGESLTEDSTVLLNAGTYYIRVYHFGAGSGNTSTSFGNFALNVYDAPVPPANDWVTTAATLTPAANGTCVMSSTQSTLNATASGQSACTGTATKDIWYKFTAQIPVCTLTVTPVTPGSTFNPVVSVYDAGTTFDTTTMSTVFCQNSNSTNQPEVVVMNNLVPGRQYAVRVYHYLGGAGGTGNFTICLRNTPGYWLGNLSTDWRTAANWSDNAVPTAATRVVIGPGRPNYPVLSSSQSAKNLNILSGGSFTMNSGSRLILNDTLIVSGTANLNSGGITINTAVSVPALNYNALTLAANTGTYSLTGNTMVRNVFNMGAATLNLGSYTLTDSTDMILNGTVTGTGKILFVRATAGYATLFGKSTVTNIEFNIPGGGLRINDTVQVNGTLTMTAGSLALRAGSRVFIGTNATSTGNLVSGSGSTIIAPSGSHFGIFGNASSTAITNLSLGCAGTFTMDFPKGISLGANSNVYGPMYMVNGTLNQNGFNLDLGKTTTTTFTLTTTNGRFNNSGATGFLRLNGGTGSSAITGILIDTVANASTSNPSGVSLGSNIYVKSTWSLLKGLVNLNGRTVTLSNAASISEVAGQVFTGNTGSITTTRTYSSAISSATNIAGLGLRISTTAAPGVTTLVRKHDVLTNGGNSSIKRNFTLTVASPVTLPYIELTYDSIDLNGVNRSRLKLNKYASSVWTKIGNNASTNNSAPTGWVSGINQAISGTVVFTASDSSNSLSPVFVNNNTQNVSNAIGINGVFPNPFSEQFSIDMTVVESNNATIRICDINGKVVYTQAFSVSAGQNILNVQSAQISSGVYFVSVISNEEVKTFRVVKQ